MAQNRVVRIPEYVLTRTVDDELVLLNLENEHYYGLNQVGATIWDALCKEPSVNDAIQALTREFDVEETALTADVEQLLGELSARGLVELSSS